MQPPEYRNVYIDTHIYHCFGGVRQQPTVFCMHFVPSCGDAPQPWGNVQYTCQNDLPMIQQHVWSDWTIVGEWSLAIGPATPINLLDGVGWLAAFAQAQIEAYCPQCLGQTTFDAGQGFFFWNFKIETGYDEWNYLLGLQNNWFPTTAANASYAFSCTDLYTVPPGPETDDDL